MLVYFIFSGQPTPTRPPTTPVPGKLNFILNKVPILMWSFYISKAISSHEFSSLNDDYSCHFCMGVSPPLPSPPRVFINHTRHGDSLLGLN